MNPPWPIKENTNGIYWIIYSAAAVFVVYLHASKAKILPVGIFVNAMVGAFAAEARFFDASESGLRGTNEAFVDAHHSHLQFLANSPALADVIGVKIAGEADTTIIGHFHGLL